MSLISILYHDHTFSWSAARGRGKIDLLFHTYSISFMIDDYSIVQFVTKSENVGGPREEMKLSLCFYMTHCFFFFLRRYNTLFSLVSFCSQICGTHINIYIYIYILFFFLFSALYLSLCLSPRKNCAQHSYVF